MSAHVFRKILIVPFLLGAMTLVASCLGDDTGPACAPTRCTFGQACVDYITDMSVGRQCITIQSPTCNPEECKCAITSACSSPTGVTCEAVDGGVHLSNCLLRI